MDITGIAESHQTSQHSFLDFNQPLGLHMDPENRWVKMADRIPRDEFERSKRLTADVLREANEYLLEKQEKEQGDGPSAPGGGGAGEEGNSGASASMTLT